MSSVASRPTPAVISAETEEAARLFAEHSEQIFGYCLRYLRSRPEAEDAVQTTFLYALRALRRGVVPECESAWLTAIAKNVCRWQQRTLDRRGPLASDLDLDRVGLAQPRGDEDVFLSDLKDALASLPERQRHALLLREWQGLPSREIATRLEMTPTATYALLARARRSLANAVAAPQRPVFGLNFALLLYQLRTHVKALIGGVGTKAATATVVVVGVVGGVAVETALKDERSAPRVPAAAVPGARAEVAIQGVALAEKRRMLSKDPSRQRGAAIPTGVQPAVLGAQGPAYVERAILQPTRLSGGNSGSGTAEEPAASPRLDEEPAPTLPVEVPPVPELEPAADLVPPDLLPPIPSLPPLPSGDLPSAPLPDPGLPPLP